MTADPTSFAGLMARVRRGDEAAACQVFQAYARRLIALAGSRLAAGAAAREDPEDVVQSVCKSFFVRYREGQFEVSSWDDLWALLTVITLRKCADRADFHRAQCRDAARERPLGPDAVVAGRLPTPDEAAVLAETVEGLFRAFDPEDRPIIELSLQGFTAPEISDRLGRARRTVRRVRERVKHHLEACLTAAGG